MSEVRVPFPNATVDPEVLEAQLFDAVERGDTEGLLRFLRAGVNPSSILNSTGETPLFYAVRSGSIEAVELLLVFGADPSIRNLHGETARSIAAATNPALFGFFENRSISTADRNAFRGITTTVTSMIREICAYFRTSVPRLTEEAARTVPEGTTIIGPTVAAPFATVSGNIPSNVHVHHAPASIAREEGIADDPVLVV
jgi:hypothetical protein